MSNFVFVKVDYVAHLFVVESKQVQRIVLYEEVVTWRDRLQCEFRLARAAFLIDKEGVSSIRTARVEPLNVVLVE